MPVRKIITIDEEKCDGCGLCVPACHEGAIEIIDGKARLKDEVLCDGLGDCLGECPQGAILVEEREAPEYDEIAVQQNLQQPKVVPATPPPQSTSGCPGAAMRSLQQPSRVAPPPTASLQSQLGHWPVQLMLVPPHAPFLRGAELLICADCVPFAVPDFHSRYLAGRAVLVGCPKLDDLQHYAEKLKEIFALAQPASVTVLKMEVPCCNGIAQAALWALEQSGSELAAEVHTIGIRGEINEQAFESRHAAS
ncbi:MAG: 4Fe-4S binding protein [bacterium]